jgi:hypothetical protein
MRAASRVPSPATEIGRRRTRLKAPVTIDASTKATSMPTARRRIQEVVK